MTRGNWENGKRAGDRMRGLEYIEERSIPEPNTGCWLWIGSHDRKGYGRISQRTFGEALAHRYSYSCKNSLSADLCVLHKCDNPACVNPDHLFEGTNADNTRDMVTKGRARGHKGEDASSVLTEDLVRWIRNNLVKGHPVKNARRIAEQLGVGHSTVLSAFNRKTWGHVE